MSEAHSSAIQFALERVLSFSAYVLVAFLALFALENMQVISVDLIFFQGEVPLGLWSLFVFVGGVAVVAVPVVLKLRESRPSLGEGWLLLLLLVPSLVLCGLVLLLIFL